jgi:hypothetical protein
MSEQDIRWTKTNSGKVIPHHQSESVVRAIAKARGLGVYLSTRYCQYHGARVVRDLAGCCTTCLDEGASRSRARR